MQRAGERGATKLKTKKIMLHVFRIQRFPLRLIQFAFFFLTLFVVVIGSFAFKFKRYVVHVLNMFAAINNLIFLPFLQRILKQSHAISTNAMKPNRPQRSEQQTLAMDKYCIAIGHMRIVELMDMNEIRIISVER